MSLNSYLIVAGGMPDRALVDRLATACGGHALVTDQSAGRACFELKGDAVVELLMMESATDFAADAFGLAKVVQPHGRAFHAWYILRTARTLASQFITCSRTVVSPNLCGRNCVKRARSMRFK